MRRKVLEKTGYLDLNTISYSTTSCGCEWVLLPDIAIPPPCGQEHITMKLQKPGASRGIRQRTHLIVEWMKSEPLLSRTFSEKLSGKWTRCRTPECFLPVGRKGVPRIIQSLLAQLNT
jgi:hypothetical protein